MSEVRKHTRRTASGRTVPVRRHQREAGAAGPGEPSRRGESERPESRPPYAGDLPPAEPPAEPDIWDGDSAPPPGDWWWADGDEDDEDDAERYRQRAAQLEAAGDAHALMEAEAAERDRVLADAAAQRMIAERASDEGQWA